MFFLQNQYPTHQFDILTLLETHHTQKEDLPDLITEYSVHHHLIHSPAPISDPFSGIVVMVNGDFTVLEKNILLPGRIITIKFEHNLTNEQYHLTLYYGVQPSKTSKDQLEKVFSTLTTDHTLKTNSIILGDFNFVNEDVDRTHGMNKWDKSTAKLWNPIQTEFLWSDPFRHLYPKRRLYSFQSTIGPQYRSRIDRMYVSQHNLGNVIKYTYIPTPFFDHKIQEIHYTTDIQIGPGTWKMNTSILPDRLFEQIIDTLLEEMAEKTFPDKGTWWEVFLLAVRSHTIAYTKHKSRTKNKLKTSLANSLERIQAIPPEFLSPQVVLHMEYLQEQLKRLQLQEVEGYIIRSRLPRFEDKEPNIEHYAHLEKSRSKANIISILTDPQGHECTHHNDILTCTHEFYTQLYTSTVTDSNKQNQLLNKVDVHLTQTQQTTLDAPLSLPEITKAVFQLPKEKTPGRDGIPIEFYQHFWQHIQYHYLHYVNEAYHIGFKNTRNMGITKLIYKKKGDPKQLSNYRPISLLNCDQKILTKTLANRLKLILPTIIHKTQTAVYGRKIDYTIHLIRDLIQLAEDENLPAGLIFLDQEKAFDRVNHAFLFRVMRQFQIGEVFITWLKQLYNNATTAILVNGYHTPLVTLKRGVRQGCPLSPLLYVLIIEILALQMRQNPNIVGFTVGGEKIVSMHYADDAVIVIKENCCFKEVYKEITDYEVATGAKINSKKTQGLWIGAWKTRTDSPLGYEWTNKNVENLGVFFGNDDPALTTFNKIVPKLEKSISFWKQFYLSKLAKARVIEIFHASQLWYAAKFYSIPTQIHKHLQTLFLNYINWPFQRKTVAEAELMKLREDGGLSLVDIQCKSHSSKGMWIIDILTNPTLNTHLELALQILGTQRGHKKGIELFFVPINYAHRMLKVNSTYYKEAIMAFSTLDIQQGVPMAIFGQQNIHFNRIFMDTNDKPFHITHRCDRDILLHYHTYQIEDIKRSMGQPHDKNLLRIYDLITYVTHNSKEHAIITKNKGYLSLAKVTQKTLYNEFISTRYTDHHSTQRWEIYFPQPLQWNQIWQNCHNTLSMETTKTLIWEQLHLNFFTQYCHNKGTGNVIVCPLCHILPHNRMHVILTCSFTKNLWRALEPHLLLIYPERVNEYEMAFGINANTPQKTLRNWLTFKLRQSISRQEQIAHNHPNINNSRQAKKRMNTEVRKEILHKYHASKKKNSMLTFLKHFQIFETVVQITESNIEVSDVFDI